MSGRACTEEEFLHDVGAHVMEIQADNDVHRCIRFGKPGTSCMHFVLTTWPGHLCISGDMGTFVFSRLRDMFQFFRSKPTEREKVPINASYWAEKCEAEDTRGQGVRIYDKDILREHARSAWESAFLGREADDEAKEGQVQEGGK